MLLQFNFSNFRSFKNETSLDLTASKETEHHYHIREENGESVLPTAVIFGANASGKSNVYKAFECLHSYVLNSIQYANEEGSHSRYNYRIPHFLFSEDNENKPTSMEIIFTLQNDVGKKRYKYGFSILSCDIQEEWLYVCSKTSSMYRKVFQRELNVITYGASFITKEYQNNLKVSLSSKVLALSLGKLLQIPIIQKVHEFFADNVFVDYSDPLAYYEIEQYAPKGIDDANYKRDVVKYLASFDDSIKSFACYTADNDDTEDKRKMANIFSIHRNAENDKVYVLPIFEESSGTVKMFSLFSKFKSVITKGGVLFIDELNSRLHPLLVRAIVQTFLNNDSNPYGAQLIFTSHDAWQLTYDLFRRDEIWFVEKNDNGVSDIYSLSQFEDENGDKIRKDENFGKNYLVGKYGAIPYIRPFNFFKEGDAK